jgi:hypothetical protein
VRELVGARIVTPGDWTDLDLEPSTRHRSIAAAVRRAVASNPGLAGCSARLISLLDDVARRAYDGGGFFCSSLVLSSDDGPLAANVLMQLCETGVVGRPTGSVDDVCAGLAAEVTCDPGWADADVSVVVLDSVGPAVRLVVVAGGVSVQYLVPVPESSEYVVLTFTSPSAPYAAAFVELFDSMAASFALDYDIAPAPNE